MRSIWTYLKSRLAYEHLIVAIAIVFWVAAAIWQLWVFGNRPELIIAAIVMGFAGGAIGYHLAIVNRVDSDKKDQQKIDEQYPTLGEEKG